jgi:hypothetical protein
MSTQFTFIRSLLGTAMVSGLCLPVMAADGGFFEDAKTDLLLRNYYFNRDFRDQAAPKSQIEEWAQGFILKLKSGYTPGTVGFGLDGIAMLGISSTVVALSAVPSYCRCMKAGARRTTLDVLGSLQKCVFPPPNSKSENCCQTFRCSITTMVACCRRLFAGPFSTPARLPALACRPGSTSR